MNIVGNNLDHVHIYVKDLEKARRVFSDVLGTKYIPPWVVEEHQLVCATDILPYRMDEPECPIDGFGMELIQPTGPDWIFAKYEKEVWGGREGCFCLSFKVKNLEKATDEMEARGFKVVIGDPKVWEVPDVINQVNFDPGIGPMIEFAEYGPQIGAIRELSWQAIEAAGECMKPAAPSGIKIVGRKIDHAHVYVKDIEKARRLFSEVLGTKFNRPYRVGRYQVVCSINSLGVELIQPTGPDWIFAKQEKEVWGGRESCFGLCFAVENIEEAAAEMEARGFKAIVRGYEIPNVIKEVHFDPRDFFGVMLGFCKYGSTKG